MRDKLIILPNGKKAKVYSVGYLAYRLKRTTKTIRNWQKAGVIPPPVIRLGEQRWYLAREVEIYASVFEQERLKQGRAIEDTNFSERIHAEIAALEKELSSYEKSTEETT